LKQKYDLILIDSAPVAIAHDGVDLSRIVDGVVLVLEAEKTRGPAVKSVKDRIVNNGGKILGIVFNKRRYYIPGWMYKRL
jgi:Mrp family chromosome partitioning ATPase